MILLFETSVGFAIFKVLKEKKHDKAENLYKDFETADQAIKLLALRDFVKFDDTPDALVTASANINGRMSKGLKKCLQQIFVEEAHEELAVSDAKLGNCIESKLNINCVSNSAIQELMRNIRMHLDSLLEDLPKKEPASKSLGFDHGLSRYKFKSSPNKMDKMVIMAVSSLVDLDKELNNYVMRCKEWYGWHFPELTKIIPDNNLYIKIVLSMGFRENAINTDFSGIISKEDEQKVKQMADISVGTEILDENLTNIKNLCDKIQNMQECRARLFEFLKIRMDAFAPNVAALVGAMVGARLIKHAGSLVKLAKHPASTVQILGAERSHFSALKVGLNTPKHGLIYHSQLVGQSNKHLKGKVSRMLAAKISLAARVDAFGEKGIVIGTEHCAKLKTSLKMLEEGMNSRISGLGKGKARYEKEYKAPDVSFLKTEKKDGKRKFDDEELAMQFKKSNVDFKELEGSKRKFDGEELAPQFKNLKVEVNFEEEGDSE